MILMPLFFDPFSIDNRWKCLEVFCLANGSVIDHLKISFWASFGVSTPQVSRAGCKQIKDGEVFNLLSISMGFPLQSQDRWR